MKKRHLRFDLSESEWNYLIDEWVLGKRNKSILREFIVDEISMGELAEKYNLSLQGIQKVIYKCEDKIFPKAEKITKSRN